MTPFGLFLCGFSIALAALGGVVATGLAARRRAHIALVGAFFVALGFTIWQARRMGAELDLEAAGAITPVHLFLAKLTAAAYLLPVVTGLLTLRNPSWRPRHRLLAFTLVGMTLATAVTGVWMTLAAS